MQNDMQLRIIDYIEERLGSNAEITLAGDGFNATFSGEIKDYDIGYEGLTLCIEDYDEIVVDLDKYQINIEQDRNNIWIELKNDECSQNIIVAIEN